MKTHAGIPRQALLLSLSSLAVPVLITVLLPAWVNRDLGFLLWVLALLPVIVFSQHRGWKGAAAGYAAAVLTFAAAQVGALLLGAALPRVEVMAAAMIVLAAAMAGSGWLSERFRRALDDAQRLALTDAGTSLPNRRHAMLHLQRAFAAAEHGADLTVVLFDVDHFKRVNDRFGHDRGDEVLREFAAVLREHTHAEHLAARFGGEEFIAVLDGSSAAHAKAYAERVRASFSERCVTKEWGRITASAGIAEYERGMASHEVVVAAADQALYRAKQEGRDRSVILGRAGAAGEGSVKLPAQPGTTPPVGRGETVLVVDDDPGVLRTVVQTLKRRGFNAIGAPDPERALAITRSLHERVDVLVVDVIMPLMSGFRMVEILTQTQHPVRALYISGNPVDEVDWSGVPGSVKAFQAKPFNMDELVLGLRTVLDAPVPRPARIVRPGVPPTESPSQQEQADGPAHESKDLDAAYAEMLQRLAWATEFRDDVTGEHARRVGWLAARIAAEMDLPPAEVAMIEHAAPLHDVGKIAIPDSILNKAGPLTSTERTLMQDHCTAGARILGGSKHPLVRYAYVIALSHHERWDGKGYPHRLVGDAIPLPGRITAVADAFDALTSVRPYRRALPASEAMEQLMADAGSYYDPNVIAAFLRLYGRGELQRMLSADGYQDSMPQRSVDNMREGETRAALGG